MEFVFLNLGFIENGENTRDVKAGGGTIGKGGRFVTRKISVG